MEDGESASSWDWHHELESICGKVALGRSEEAITIRRCAEEAERSASRRAEELERCMLRCQAEESSALRGFLSGWNRSWEGRLERYRTELVGRVAAVERSLAEAAEHTRADSGALRESIQQCLDGQRADACMHEARVDQLRAEVGAVVEEAVQDIAKKLELDLSTQVGELEQSFARRVDELRQGLDERHAEAHELVKARMDEAEAQTRQSHSGLQTTLGDAAERVAGVEQQVDGLRSQLQTDVQATISRHAVELTAVKSQLAGTSEAVRFGIGAAERRAEEGVARLTDRLQELSSECASRFEAQAEGASRLEAETQASAEAAAVAHTLSEASASSEREAKQALRDMHQRMEHCDVGSREAIAALEEQLRACERSMRQLIGEGVEEVGLIAAKGLRSEAAELGAQVAAVQHALGAVSSESKAGLSELRRASAENVAEIRTVCKDCEKVAAAVELLMEDGACYEWLIPRFLQRLRYLSMATESGLWLDSEPFFLGAFGPLTLRLYPRGARSAAQGSDGQCAVALLSSVDAAESARMGASAYMSLSVGNLSRRVPQRRGAALDVAGSADAGSAMWLAESLGDVEGLLSGEDLCLRAAIPLLRLPQEGWPSKAHACSSPGPSAPWPDDAAKIAPAAVAPELRCRVPAVASPARTLPRSLPG